MKKPTPPPRPRAPDPHIRPGAAIDHAREELADDEARVAAASAAHLTKLLALAVKERKGRYRDAELTESDRTKLDDSMDLPVEIKPSLRWSISAPGGFKRAWGRSRPRVATLLKLLIVVIVVALALRAWGNTAIIVALEKPAVIKWPKQGGGTIREEFSVGDTLIAVRNFPSGYSARKWESWAGYMYVPVALGSE